MKFGLFGGTFNPIHHGHLINAQFVREKFDLDKLFFIPSLKPVHKELSDDVQAMHRFDMITLAIGKESPFFEVSKCEIERRSPSYTILTIGEFEVKFPGIKLYLIIGGDSYNEIETWKDYHEIQKRISIIVLKRPGTELAQKNKGDFEAGLEIIENPMIDISSSCIRKRIAEGKSIKYLVPETVEKYIKEKELYLS